MSPREKLLSGAQALCNLVKITLGPKGRNVVLGTGPIITNDGVTVANAFKLADPEKNLGVEILRQASQKTNQQAGDGTTSAIILANEILAIANKKIKHGASPVILKDQLLAAAKIAEECVDKIAVPCDEYETLLHVTTNSSASQIDGKMVADAITRVGSDGVVIIEENTHGTTELTFSDGIQSPLTLASPYFACNPARLESTVNDAYLLVATDTIGSIKDLVPALELAREKALKLVIAAPDFSPEVIAALVINRVRGGLDIIAIKANSDAVLGDIAAVTNATVMGTASDIKLEAVTESHLGTAEKIICNMTDTKIMAHKTPQIKQSTDARVAQIRGQIEACHDEYMTQKLRERLAKLTSGIARISVGCATQIETHERKLRIDDALAAGLAARKDGIVRGAGLTYAHVSIKILTQAEPSNTLGAKILARALPIITKQICRNASVRPSKFVRALTSDIIDPATVIKNVIINATSVASTLLTTEAIVL